MTGTRDTFVGDSGLLKRTVFPEVECNPDEVILIHPNGSFTVEKCCDVFPGGKLNSEAVFVDGGRLIRFVVF